MHFISGGAFNGKRKYVKERLQSHYEWYSAYCNQSFPSIANVQADIVVIEGIERYLYQFSQQKSSIDYIRQQFLGKMIEWKKWEEIKDNRKVIVIGTDITKGIVPLKAIDRKTRDVTGYCYQDLVQLSSDVTVIWFGLEKKLKGGK